MNQPDNVYLNIRIETDTDGPKDLIAAKYETTKDTPILARCSDYYATVVDFTIPTSSIPIFIADCIPNPADPLDPNYMAAAFAMSYLASYQLKHVEYKPENNFPQTKGSPYYYVYSFTAVLEMFNSCLADLWVSLGRPGGAGFRPPYYQLNPATGLISLIVSEAFISSGAKIYLNNFTYPFLQSFNYYLDLNLASQAEYKVEFYDQGNTCNENGGQRNDPTQSYYYYESEYYSLQDWLQIRKLYIYSTSIPVFQEYAGATNEPGGKSLNPTYPVLFDFTPQYNVINTAGVITYYRNAGHPRLLDLCSDRPLTNINVEVKWMDINGRVYPLYLRSYQSITIKLGFFKKQLYKNYWPNTQL